MFIKTVTETQTSSLLQTLYAQLALPLNENKFEGFDFGSKLIIVSCGVDDHWTHVQNIISGASGYPWTAAPDVSAPETEWKYF